MEMNKDNGKVFVSKGTFKLEGIDSINTNTLTNDFCQKMWHSKNESVICRHCYSIYRLSCIRKSCQKKYQQNSEVLSGGVLPLEELPRLNYRWFRFNSHGELINKTHLINLINICKVNLGTIFALWTKRKELIKDADIPDNLILIYSNPFINTIAERPDKFHKTFNVFNEPANSNCGGLCRECMACYEKDSGVDVIIEQIKYGIGQTTWEDRNR